MPYAIDTVMLVYPPVTRPGDFSAERVRVSTFFPLGLAYLAAVLEERDRYRLVVLDALIEGDVHDGIAAADGSSIRYGLDDEAIRHRIADAAPDVIAVSCLFAAMQEDAANVCRLAKEVDPRIVTVVGGAHAGVNAATLMHHYPAIDFVVIGEGDATLPELLSRLEQDREIGSIDGLAFRVDGRVVVNPKQTYIEDLDRIPFPARHLFPMKRYFSSAAAHSVYRRTPFTQMITSRGCPCKCAFCALGKHWGARQRRRSAENVLAEIEHLVRDYGIREIHFEDDNLTADKERALAIFDGIIERGLDICWNVPSGMAVYTLDDELIDKMAASGCYSVSLAIESGNQEVLHKLMNKPVDLKKVPPLVKKIRAAGMDARGFFILGYPDESRETMEETIAFARDLELDWAYFFVASPLPNTRMWDRCIEKGYIKPEDFDPVRSFHRSIIHTPEFDPDYVAAVRERAIIEVNFRHNPNLRTYDVDKAIRDFRDVATKYPHFDFAQFYLGEALRKKGDLEAARQAYQAALAANPDHAEAKQRLAELAAIGGDTAT